MSVATAVPPTSFEVELEQQPDEEGAAAEAPAERKRLQLTSSSGAAAGMSASVNSRVARGPDGTRGFALQRTDLRQNTCHHWHSPSNLAPWLDELPSRQQVWHTFVTSHGR